jgi:hypothetical protein
VGQRDRIQCAQQQNKRRKRIGREQIGMNECEYSSQYMCVEMQSRFLKTSKWRLRWLITSITDLDLYCVDSLWEANADRVFCELTSYSSTFIITNKRPHTSVMTTLKETAQTEKLKLLI